jgi:uncharacterized protein (DUF1501 family)
MRPTRCIECEEIQLARVTDARPSQTLPIPIAALEGDAARGGLTRRSLLAGGLAGFAAVYGSRILGFEEVFESAVAQASAPPGSCLVLLYLAGGNDGLNTIVPGPGLNGGADYANYAAARSALHRTQGSGGTGSTPIAGTGSQLSWANLVTTANNGASRGFDTMYGAGDGGAGSDLAFMPAVDYLPYSMSHFDSSDYWFAGALSAMPTGWLGRWLDNNGSATNPLQGISIDSALSKALRTASKPVCAINSLSTLGFSMDDIGGIALPHGTRPTADINAAMNQLASVPAGAGNVSLVRSRSTYATTVTVGQKAGPLAHAGTAGVAYPAGTLSTKLQMAAKILAAGLGTRIVTIHWGVFDTHGGQLAMQDPQLQELAAAMGAFQADLQARGVEQNVATLLFSEFGRRVGENASGGTDHGAGGLMLAAGSAVKGGWASPFPGTRTQDLDGVGNLKVPTDFRSVYKAVLSEWLGGDLTGVLPGGPFPALQRQDGTSNLFG